MNALGAGCFLAILASSWRSTAQERSGGPPLDARSSAERGELSPFTQAPFVDARVAKVRAGFDGAAGKADVQADASAPVASWLALRAGAAYDGLGGTTRPYAFGLVSLLREADVGVGLGAQGGFEARGFNTVPSVVLGLTGAKHLGRVLLLSGVSYGQALRGPERSGRLQLAATTRVTDRLQLGLDSRGELDLERDGDEPAEEPDFRVRGGPFASFTFGAFALSAGGGVAALRYRLSPSVATGAMGFAALGAVF